MKKISAFVPLKLESRRLPNKNFLRLGDRPLAYHIFKTLQSLPEISDVYCYTSQPQILEFLPDEIQLLMRPPRLDKNQVKANELFQYAIGQIDSELIVLAHATGPFVKKESIQQGIDKVLFDKYDCAFSVLSQRTYAWFKGKPLNYNPKDMDQTQDLSPVYLETSGFYVFKKEDYIKNGTRIGANPFFVEVDFKESIDIDEPEDFSLATLLNNFKSNEKMYSDDLFFVDWVNNSGRFFSKKIKHISFDLDGVIIDSLQLMEHSWNAVQKQFDIDVSFLEYKKHIGLPFFNILKNLGLPESLHDGVYDVYNRESSCNLDRVNLFDFVEISIIKARESGRKISLVTSKNRERTKEILEFFNISYLFDTIITPDDIKTGRGKPNPDPLLLACIKLGVNPSETVYIGDMDADRLSARRAGIRFIYAAWGFSDLTCIKDPWFHSMNDLMGYILENSVAD